MWALGFRAVIQEHGVRPLWIVGPVSGKNSATRPNFVCHKTRVDRELALLWTSHNIRAVLAQPGSAIPRRSAGDDQTLNPIPHWVRGWMRCTVVRTVATKQEPPRW